MKRIVIFASGAGSNAAKIIAHFAGNSQVEVAAVFSNKSDAGVLDIARKNGIAAIAFTRDELNSGTVLSLVEAQKPDLIVLAGFLLKFPADIVAAFPRKIINIHPALLPKYGGKGMFGMNVHRAVSESGDAKTGITIHYVDEHYDNGDIIFQAEAELSGRESCEEISKIVQKLEHTHFPTVIEKLLN